MSEPTTVKRYPNRRLYDTRLSRYITRGDICRMVLEEEPFVIVDQKSGSDITLVTLHEVLTDRARSGHPMLDVDGVRQIINGKSPITLTRAGARRRDVA
jgi:polyhydroxyalkanoate synthesis repressor PhaR